MTIDITLRVNGVSHTLEVEPTETLVDVLRKRLGLTGTNRDCGMGICGVCTVMLDGSPVSSCILLAGQADGAAVTTIEAIERDGRLSPVQEAFLRFGASQCGFCTPGFVITASALLAENPHPSRDEIVEALKGNLCRCTGYKRIVEAVEWAARQEIRDDSRSSANQDA